MTSWSCSDSGEDCRKTMCCNAPRQRCFRKDLQWASCLASCTPGVHTDRAVTMQGLWGCAELTRPEPMHGGDLLQAPAPKHTLFCWAVAQANNSELGLMQLQYPRSA